MSDKTAPILSKDQRDKVMAAIQALLRSGLKDPDKGPTIKDYLARTGEDLYEDGALLDLTRTYWQDYLIYAASDGLEGSKVSTPNKRKSAIRKLTACLDRRPTVALLKAEFPLVELDEVISQILDVDIAMLSE